MKKIIGILVVLGLVLSMAVMATPVMAKVSKAVVTLGNPCAGKYSTYNITFNVTADLLDGGTTITIVFPAGTDISKLKTITVQQIGVGAATAVPATWITISGQTLTLYSPLHIVVANGPVVSVFCDTNGTTHGIKNPLVGSTKYTVDVSTSAPVDSTPVTSGKYTVQPNYSTYKLVWDSSPTYPGLVEDFVPPFKVCGQTNSTFVEGAVEYGDKYLNAFDLTFIYDKEGCNPPCVNATVTGALTKTVPGANVTLVMNGTWFWPELNTAFAVGNITGLTTTENITWPSYLHFDQVGEYELCFNVTCPPVVCTAPGEEVIARECYTFKVYQWKDVYQIDLYRKWNLISLPLVPFDTTINGTPTAILASWNGTAAIEGIWYYDREPCDASEWEQWPAPGALTDMEDGKAYWVKVAYNHSKLTEAAGLFAGGLYVWGTAEPMPPKSPSSYDVCEGWNMVGIRSMTATDDVTYLWNFKAGGNYLYGMIYDWVASTQTWNAQLPGGPANLLQTKGYWIPFALDGTIYP